MTHPAKADQEIELIKKRLTELAERFPELAEPIAFYRAALPALQAAQANIEPFTLPVEVAQRKLDTGLPLLANENLPLAVEATRELFLRLCRIIESLNSRSTAARQIRQAVENNTLDLSALWTALADGNGLGVERWTIGLQLDPEVVRLLAENSLKPALHTWAHGLRTLADWKRWRQGYCPLCGSRPLLGEIQGKEGERRLRCGLCGTSWYYPRLQCAFCANRDYRALGHITVEGEEEKYRVQTCDQCGGYLKIVVTFDPTPVTLLPVEDLVTLHLDLIAVERGYKRGGVTSKEENK